MNKYWGSVAIVSGTSIGAAMLAIPTISSHLGCIPTILLFVFMAYAMYFSASVIVDLLHNEKSGITLIGLNEVYFGWIGRVISIVLWLSLFYALSVAYLDGLTNTVVDNVNNLFKQQSIELFKTIEINKNIFMALLSITMGWLLIRGTGFVDIVNRVFTFGLIGSFVIMSLFLLTDFDLSNIKYYELKNWMIPIPIIATAFGFHPVLTNIFVYMKRDVVSVKQIALIGTMSTLLLYTIWIGVSLGAIPKLQLVIADQLKQNVTVCFNNTILYVFGIVFLVCAIMTSYLGVSLGLIDFLFDTFKLKRTSFNEFLMVLTAFIPPYFIVMQGHDAMFKEALEWAALPIAFIIGLIPLVMGAINYSKYNMWTPYKYIATGVSVVGFTMIVVVKLIGVFTGN